MIRALKNLWVRVNLTPIERELEKAENIYELERMLKRYSYIHNIKGWLR